jgi:hypothetical protein
MGSKNERVELEMKIMKQRLWATRITDVEFPKLLRERIAEQKLREIDE